MEVQRSYLTRDHERLLNYAVWAKYIAWVVLGVYALGAVLGFVGRMSVASVQLGTLRSEANSFARLLAAEPGFALNLLFGSISSLFQGLVYFLVLKGISLGLYMIAETDVNYRDREEPAQ